MDKIQSFVLVLMLFCISVYCNETTDHLSADSPVRQFLTPELEGTIDEAKKLVQQTCQPKWKIADETVLNAMKTKNPPQDKNFKCFMHCIMEMIGVMKKNKFDLESAKKQIDTYLPPAAKEKLIPGLEVCVKKVQWVKNGCDNAMLLALCMKEEFPEFTF